MPDNTNTENIDDLDLPIITPAALTLQERIINCPLTKFLQRLPSQEDKKE